MKNFSFLCFCYFCSCLLQLFYLYLHFLCTIKSGHAKQHKAARLVKGIWEKGVHEMRGKQESAGGEKQLSCHSFIKSLEYINSINNIYQLFLKN